MGGAMDLVASDSKVMVLTEHCSKNGKSKILKKCRLPLTGTRCVDKIITELAVFEVKPDGQGLILTDISNESSLEEVQEKTEAEFEISKDIKYF